MKKPVIIIILSIIGIILLTLVISVTYYFSMTGPVSKESEEVIVNIEQGSTSEAIGSKLKDNNVIKSKLVFDIYTKLNNVNDMKAGEYALNKNMSMQEIVNMIQSGDDLSQRAVTITFIEGKNIRWIASTIAENTTNSEDDVYGTLSNAQYLNKVIQKYWFLTDEIKNSDLYYPLEGYLFPDTYQLKSKKVSVEEIFDTMLNETEKKLSPYKSEIQKSGISVHKLLTVASIVELEASTKQDKAGVASVIYNRIKYNMSLGSDVTTYYAFKVDMADRQLTQQELDTYNVYNTRGPDMNGKLPVGPICSVGIDAIYVSLHPSETNYLYFVADKNGKLYFAENISEHEEIISELQNKDLWFTYE